MSKIKSGLKLINMSLTMIIIMGPGAGCGAGQTGQKTFLSMGQAQSAKETYQSEPAIYVDELLNNPDSFSDHVVTVKGKFMGWQGNCRAMPPETRSDWMLMHNGQCLYVSGPVPLNLRRERNSADIGRDVEVRGNIRFDKEKQPYLKVLPDSKYETDK
ncbi:MAG: hypothetical protein KJ737_10740 [Proteobacteria bacterium]|nr:hypothetical protein [Pseudomonadota bacterium]